MKNLRRHLGPGYTEYPAKKLADFCGDKIFKLVMWIICCILWSGVYYIAIAVVNLNRTNFLEGAKPMTNAELYVTAPSLCVFAAGCFVLIFVVIRSRRGEKKYQKHHHADPALRRPQK